MQELNVTSLEEINGGLPSESVGEFFEGWGYAVGYTYGYIKENVILTDRWVDDLAELLVSP